MDAIRIVLGTLLLALGRRLFWLFVGVVGFVAGISLAPSLFPDQPGWVLLIIGIVAGVIGAILAVFLQGIMVGIAGFIAGAYLAQLLASMFGVDFGSLNWIVYVVGGVIGAILVASLFDWALIILSSLTGAGMIVQGLGLAGSTETVAFLLLFVVGVIIQAGIFYRRRTVRVRR